LRLKLQGLTGIVFASLPNFALFYQHYSSPV